MIAPFVWNQVSTAATVHVRIHPRDAGRVRVNVRFGAADINAKRAPKAKVQAYIGAHVPVASPDRSIEIFSNLVCHQLSITPS